MNEIATACCAAGETLAQVRKISKFTVVKVAGGLNQDAALDAKLMEDHCWSLDLSTSDF